MNATASMLEAPLEKIALAPDIGGALMRAYEQLGTKGLAGLIPGVDSYAASGLAGIGASELTSRLMPEIARRSPKKVKALQALASGLAGGGTGVGSAFIAAPLLKDLKKVPTSKLLPELASMGALAGGAELLAAPYIGKTTGVLEPLLATAGGAGLVSAGQGIRKKINLDNFLRAAKKAGKEVDAKPVSYTKSIMDAFKRLPGGSLPAGAGAALLATGSPVLGGSALLSAPMMNNSVTKYLGDISRELDRSKQIKDLYKKSSLNAPLATELTKLAAPAYMTLSPNSLEAYTMDKQANFRMMAGEFIGKGLGTLFGGSQARRALKTVDKTMAKGLEARGLFTGGGFTRGGKAPSGLVEELTKNVKVTTPTIGSSNTGFLSSIKGGLEKKTREKLMQTRGVNSRQADNILFAAGRVKTPRRLRATKDLASKRQELFEETLAGSNPSNANLRTLRDSLNTTRNIQKETGTIRNLTPAQIKADMSTGKGTLYTQPVRINNQAANRLQTAETELAALDSQLVAAKDRLGGDNPMVKNLEQRRGEVAESVNTARTGYQQAASDVFKANPNAANTSYTRAPIVDTSMGGRSAANTELQAITNDLQAAKTELTNLRANPGSTLAQRSFNAQRIAELEQKIPNIQKQFTEQQNSVTQGINAELAKSRSRFPATPVTNPEVAGIQEYMAQATNAEARLRAVDSQISGLGSSTPATENALAALNKSKARLEKQITEGYTQAAQKGYGSTTPQASSLSSLPEVTKARTDLTQEIGRLESQLSSTSVTSPADKAALQGRLGELQKQQQALDTRRFELANPAELTSKRTVLETNLKAQENILAEGTSTQAAKIRAKAEKARLEGELGKVTSREQQIASEAEAATLQTQREAEAATLQAQRDAATQAGRDSIARTQELRSKMTAPTRDQSNQAQRAARQELGSTGASADFRVKGLNDSSNNYVREQGLIPREYAQFEKGTLRVSRTGASQAAKNSGLNDAVNQADRVIREELFAVNQFNRSSPMVEVMQNNPNLRRELNTRVKSFIRNPKMTPDQLKAELTGTMGMDVTQATSFVEGLSSNPNITAARNNLDIASNQFSREMNTFMSKEFRASSDKITKNVSKAFKKVKGLSEQETAQFQGIVSSLEQSGVNASAEGNAILKYLEGNMGSADSARIAIADMSKLLNGETVTLNTRGSEKLLSSLRGNAVGRQGNISLSPKQIERLRKKGLSVAETTRGDLSQFGAKNLRSLETHFKDKGVAKELQELSVASNEGASAVNKVMSGNASIGEFSAKELNALNITPYKPTTGVPIPKGYANKSPGEVVRQTTNQITAQEKIIKSLQSKKKLNYNQQKSLNAAKKEVTDLQILQADAQTYISNNQNTLDRFTNEVRNARIQYEAQGGVEGALNFTGNNSAVFEQSPGLFSGISGATDNVLRGSQYAGEKGVGALGLGIGGAGLVGATAYGARPSDSTYMRAAASFGLSPLAPPVRYLKKTAMMAPVKFKGNSVPKMLGAPVVESPMTSTHIHKYMQAPVG